MIKVLEGLLCERADGTLRLDTASHGAVPPEDSRYLPQVNEYRCPAGKRLTWGFGNVESGRTLDTYLLELGLPGLRDARAMHHGKVSAYQPLGA